MMNLTKRFLALILAMLFLLPCAAPAEEDPETEEITEAAAGTDPGDEAVTEKDGWHFNARGFLTGENPGDEYILEDEKKGLWQYASADLAITVTRYQEKTKKKKKQEYCVAEIRASAESPLGIIQSDPKSSLKFKGEALPGIEQRVVTDLIEKHPSVLAVSDDMYGLRLTPVKGGKTKYDYHGVVIRNGEVKATKTRKSPEEGKKDKRPWPNLDTLAVYEDGSMKTYLSDAKTAEEYLEEGALHVFAFGPWLIADGQINPAVQKPSYYPASEPRVAIGMIEPYHYIIIAAAGRPKSKYAGAKLLWLAETMQELGCKEALNLDGGATVVMAFNNKIILQGDNSGKRNIGSLIAFGLKEGAAEEE